MGADAGPRRVLIVGATSAIAGEVARLYARRGASLVLTGRNPVRLAAVGDDLRVRGAASVETEVLDMLDRDRHAAGRVSSHKPRARRSAANVQR